MSPRGVYERKPRPVPTPQSVPPLTTEGSVLTSAARGDGVIRVKIWPDFAGEDKGDGGVRRVVEAQWKHLPKFGIELVDDPADADVIACHMEMPPPWYKLYPDKPVVAMCHGLYWDDFKWDNWAVDANTKVMNLLRAANVVTAPSEWVANAIRRATSRPVEVVHHGVDIDDWEPGASLGYVLWNKTRPDPVCDPAPLNAVAKLLPKVQFVSTFGEELDNITLTGKVSFEEAKKIIRRAGLYLCTAKETFGIGTLEAMASGVPVVGFDWGGQVDIVRNHYDGFLVQPNDANSLAMAIEGALVDRDLMGAHARERAAEFTWEKAAESYAKIFREAATQKRTSPRVSVIVTAYNLDAFLGDCLDSVLVQSDGDWECIIVDDASPDTCGQIAEDWAARDPRFRVIHNEKNVYLAEARNVGIRVARGRYILPLDADDMLAPDTVATLANALDEDRQTHISYGAVFFVEEDGVTPTTFEGYKGRPGTSTWPYPFVFETQMMQRNLMPYCSMFRREAWLNTGGYRPRCKTAEDADFWSRLTSYGFRPKMVTESPTLIYRNRSDSMSQKQGPTEWIKWFPWSKEPSITPAGAATEKQLPVASLDRPLVSVVIPVGPNHRVLVKDAIDSVDAQFFRGWECIVVNDSNAPLPELPTWVRVLDTEGQVGVAAARNMGVRASRAPLFLPLDADDYLQPYALMWMLEAYRQTRDIIYADFWEDPDVEGEFKVYELQDYDAKRLTSGTIHCVTALTPKSVWEKVGGYSEDVPAWEDWEFQLKVADAGICSRRLAAPLWTYRKHTGIRRNANVQDFERSKDGILSKWKELWEGRKTLMACSSCAARATIRPQQAQPLTHSQQAARVAGSDEDAALVQYIGPRKGNMPFKGKSGTFYVFHAGDERYVLQRDLAIFEGRPDFRVTQKPVPMISDEAKEPLLVAEGKPLA